MNISVVDKPGKQGINSFYNGNKPPLLSNSLSKLNLGCIYPEGWLKHQLELMAEGMTGRLKELSNFIDDDNGWLGSDNEGWEEQPYWFRGFYSLAVLTGSKKLLDEANKWIETIISSQDEDGYFGAKYNKCVVGNGGRKVCDLWPNMIMIDALILHFEYTQDPRIIPMLTKFFEFCRDLSDDMFIPGYLDDFGDWRPCVQHDRAGEMLPHIYWLYNHTGHDWLLKLATRFYTHNVQAKDEWLNHHVVNFTQQFRYPGNYYVQKKEKWYKDATDYWYNQHMSTWGQQPGGIFAADELIRKGATDPRQGFETCAMVEFAKSFYILGRITGESKYADRCESVMLNHFPAAQTPDLKGLHYLTASNQPQLDASEQHEYTNKGRQIIYSPWEVHRCCQHNVAMGWPWYVENLWQATGDNGILAWLYAPSKVTARVGSEGKTVTVRTDTPYPFNGNVNLRIECAQPVKFPLYLRVPDWCKHYKLYINGQQIKVCAEPGYYICIEHTFANGDRVEFNMDMEVNVTRWPRNGSGTINRGPLSYSLKIGEKWVQCGGTDEWPEWEVLPTTPWNYGLLSEDMNSDCKFKVNERTDMNAQPWKVENAPVEIKVRGKRIAGWGLENETVEELKMSPVKADSPIEELTLIPLGCARLRIACFPIVSEEDDVPDWENALKAHL